MLPVSAVRWMLPLVLVAVGAACAKQAVRPDESVESTRSDPAAAVTLRPQDGKAAASAREPGALDRETAAPAAVAVPVIYFDFDSAQLNQSSRQALDAWVGAMTVSGIGRVVIEGHADERGTEEYNLVLGERRASAVRQYLQRLGADSRNLSTVSYGEARPVRTGSGEDAWAHNRRAELKPQAR